MKEVKDKKIKRFLKVDIVKGTEIVDLYDDGDLYYKIGNEYIPIDFNDGKHSEFVDVYRLSEPT